MHLTDYILQKRLDLKVLMIHFDKTLFSLKTLMLANLMLLALKRKY